MRLAANWDCDWDWDWDCKCGIAAEDLKVCLLFQVEK